MTNGFSFEDELQGAMNPKTQEENNETLSSKDQIKDELKKYRAKQFQTAHKQTMDESNANYFIKNMIGLMGSYDIVDDILRPVQTELKKIKPDIEVEFSEVSILEKIVTKQIDADSRMILHLDSYRFNNNIEDSRSVVHTPEAMKYAIEQTYGSVENYQSEIVENVRNVAENLDKIKNSQPLQDMIFAAVKKSLPDEVKKKLGPLDMIGGAKGLNMIGKMLSGVTKVKDDLADFSKSMVFNYARVRGEEANTYQA